MLFCSHTSERWSFGFKQWLFFFYVCISVVDFRLNKGYQPVTDYLNIFTSTIGVVIARWAVVVCFVANSVGRSFANPVPFYYDCLSLLMILFCCCHWLSQCLSLCHWLTVTSPLIVSVSVSLSLTDTDCLSVCLFVTDWLSPALSLSLSPSLFPSPPIVSVSVSLSLTDCHQPPLSLSPSLSPSPPPLPKPTTNHYHLPTTSQSSPFWSSKCHNWLSGAIKNEPPNKITLFHIKKHTKETKNTSGHN